MKSPAARPQHEALLHYSPPPPRRNASANTKLRGSSISVGSSTDDLTESLLELNSVDSFHSRPSQASCLYQDEAFPDAEVHNSSLSSIGRRRQATGRVRFRVDENDCIISSHTGEKRIRLSAEEVRVMWWSREEMVGLQQDARSVCEHLLQNEAAHCRDIALLLSQCAQKDASEYCLRTSNTVRTMVHGESRGLATLLMPMFPRKRKMSIRAVLAANDLQQLSKHQRAHVMTVKYQHWSRYAVVWARVVADADTLYQQEAC